MLSSKISILLTSDLRAFDYSETILLVDYLTGLDFLILLTDKQLGIYDLKQKTLIHQVILKEKDIFRG